MTDRTRPTVDAALAAGGPPDADGGGAPWPRSFFAHLPWFVYPLVIGLVQILGTVGAERHTQLVRPTGRPIDALAWVLVLLGPAALLPGRRFPVPALAVTTLSVAVYIGRGYGTGPVYLSYVFALVWAILQGYHAYAWSSVPVLFLGEYAVPSLFAGAAWPSLGAFGTDLAWAIACLALAEGIFVRRQRVQATGRARREQARRRSSDERLAIARELHDVLAHSISLINVQAGTALEVMDKRPEQARVALEAIKLTSKQALTEVRSVLDAIRGPDAPMGALRAPTPGLDHLDALVARAGATGLDVRVRRSGAIRPLPAGVDLAAFRIIQEAVTNVVRHAAAGSTVIEIDYLPDAVRLRVLDDGRGYSAEDYAADVDGAGEGGNGLPGMRERALALGGAFAAGSRPGGGFAVEATLPTDGARRTPEPVGAQAADTAAGTGSGTGTGSGGTGADV
jgi:signal transduction histidine kinase